MRDAKIWGLEVAEICAIIKIWIFPERIGSARAHFCFS